MDRATEINKLHDEICGELRTTVQKAIRIGQLLLIQKKECGHGNWLPWLEANIKFSGETVRRYIRAYKRRNQIGPGDQFGLKELTDAISTPVKEELEEEPTKNQKIEKPEPTEENETTRIQNQFREAAAINKHKADMEKMVQEDTIEFSKKGIRDWHIYWQLVEQTRTESEQRVLAFEIVTELTTKYSHLIQILEKKVI